MTERVLRAGALAIAVLAFVDPAMTRAEQDRPTVVVLHASSSVRDLAAEVVTALEPSFEVSRVDVPGAVAYVVVGADLPEDWRPPVDARVFSVTPAATTMALNILRFAAPTETSIDSIVPIEVEVQVDGTGERDVMVNLVAEGVRLSQVSRHLTGADTRIQVPLTFVPSQAGLIRLRVEAAMPNRDSAVADRVLEVNERLWHVLAFDGRPTYSATFVRRALESDPRFKVTTRVVTSRASAIDTNAAPSALTDPTSLAKFDLIIVGATEAFGEAEASSLQRYMRERHGAVVLLPETAQGALLSRLTGQGSWQEDHRMEPLSVSPVTASGPGADVWAAAEFLWPARVPPLAASLATIARQGQALAPRPVVWQVPIGGGRLAVNSAIDGWRSRAGAASGFSAFWRAAAGGLAQATPALVDVTMRRRLLTPGQWAHVSVGMFSAGEPAGRVRGTSTDFSVRLWPVDAVTSSTGGEWTGAFRAPDMPGRYRLEVTDQQPGRSADASAVSEFLVVAQDGVDSPVQPSLERDGLAELAAGAHGGRVVSADRLASLPSQLSAVVATSPGREPWHPMHSVWWLMPFTLCASGEWWLRRHRGER